MRKKTHISVAGYLVRGLGLEELRRHKKAFCLGSILPDLNPKMFAEPHEYNGTFKPLKELMRQILDDTSQGEENERVIWRRAGVVMHYLADYFTYPHNTSFLGNLKDHCMYESRMKCHMRVLVWMPEGRKIFEEAQKAAEEIVSRAELYAYIARAHRSYMREPAHTPESDCRQILMLCATVLNALSELIQTERQGEAEELCA